jgi:hypothetical protein
MRSRFVHLAAALLIVSIPHSAGALDPGGALGGAGAPAGAGGAADAAGGAAGGALGAAGQAAGGSGVGGVGQAGAAAEGAVGAAAGAAGGGAVGAAAGAAAGGLGAAGGTAGGSVDNVGEAARAGATAGGGVTGSVDNPAAGRGVELGGESNSRGSGSAAPGRGTGGSPRGTAALSAEPPLTREQILRMGDVPAFIRLPFVLIPELVSDDDRSGGDAPRVVPRRNAARGSQANLRRRSRPLAAVPGVAPRTVSTCRNTIAAAAKPHGAISVEVASAGTPSRTGQGILRAPVEARIVYATGKQVQVRQARITCQLNAQGRVVALL